MKNLLGGLTHAIVAVKRCHNGSFVGWRAWNAGSVGLVQVQRPQYQTSQGCESQFEAKKPKFQQGGHWCAPGVPRPAADMQDRS